MIQDLLRRLMPRLRSLLVMGAMLGLGVLLATGALYYLLTWSAPPTELDPNIAERSARAAAMGTLPIDALDPSVEPTGVFELHRALELDGGMVVTGVVRNTSLTIVSRPEITVICKDETGVEIGRGQGEAAREVLLPNGTSPAMVPLPELDRCPVVETELKIERPDQVAMYARDLSVEGTNPVKNADGTWEFTGNVLNKGDRVGRYVSVLIEAYDVSGRLVGVHQVFAKGDLLPLGATTRFRLDGVRYGKEPSRFQLSATGRSAY